MAKKPTKHLLSPKLLVKGEDPSYYAVEELADALNKQDCQNIALMGPFGSGKSSIIKTLCDSYYETESCPRFLNISLATLDEKKDDIESSIIQQLIYKSDLNKTSQSRFRRILHPKESLAKYIFGFILAILIVVKPEWLQIETIYTILPYISDKVGHQINNIIDLMAIVYILYCTYCIINHLIKKFYNTELAKLHLKDGSVEISKSTSIFNKHMDEIIYYFESMDYNVVIFEDLDRCECTKKIFLKLRELNILINDSSMIKADGRVIKFVYAIRDEVFLSEERTKYFDYIVSSIPIVDCHNSMDHIGTLLEEAGLNIPQKISQEIGVFIGSMRELKNIVNELRQYNELLELEGLIEKTLPLIVYKNKHPEDYSELCSKKGILYTVLHSKELIVELRTEIYAKAKQAASKRLRELTYTDLGQGEWESDDPELYYELTYTINQNNIHISNKRNLTISKLLKECDFDKSIEMIKYISLDYYKLTCREMNNIDIEMCKTILFMLRSGNIDNSYENYISYLHPGALTSSDREFFRSLLLGENKNFGYTLNNVNELLGRIDLDHYGSNAVLNYDLIDGLLKLNTDSDKCKIVKIINNIISTKNTDFIIGYETCEIRQKDFFCQLIDTWNNYLGDISTDDVNYDTLLKIFYEYTKESDLARNFFSNLSVLSNTYYILVKYYSQLNIDELLNKLKRTRNIKFNKLSRDTESDQLFQFVLENCIYDINSHNIDVIFGDDFKTKAYTTIFNYPNNKVIEYIISYIETVHKMVPNSSTEEDVDVIIKIINNKNLSIEVKSNYLSNQTKKLVNSHYIDNTFRDLPFKLNIIEPRWSNIVDINDDPEKVVISDVVFEFININYKALQEDTLNCHEEIKTNLFKSLFTVNNLSLDAYKSLFGVFGCSLDDEDTSELDDDRSKIAHMNNASHKHRLVFS